MHYFEFAEKDATLYEASASMNSGLDEILEVRKDVSPTGAVVDASRILIKFNLSEISQSIVNGIITSPKYYLNLFDAKPSALATSQSLYVYPVSQSWTMGDGRATDNPITDEGCSWTYRFGTLDGTLWSEVSASGGTWFSGSGYEASHSFNHKSKDMRVEVTDIVNKWLTSNIENEGFMVKRSGSVGNSNSNTDEGSTTELGNFSFFSSDTHTKYPPTLEVEWDDSKWSTGSLSPLTSTDLEDMQIYMKGLRPEYNEKSKAKFRLVGKTRFPASHIE